MKFFAKRNEISSAEFARILGRMNADADALSAALKETGGILSKDDGVALYRLTGKLLAIKRDAADAFHRSRRR